VLTQARDVFVSARALTPETFHVARNGDLASQLGSSKTPMPAEDEVVSRDNERFFDAVLFDARG
jgi:hypothetical protein